MNKYKLLLKTVYILLFLVVVPAISHGVTVEQVYSENQDLRKDQQYEAVQEQLRSLIKTGILGELYKASLKNRNFKMGSIVFSELFRKFDSVNVLAANIPLKADPRRPTDLYLTKESLILVNSDFNALPNLARRAIVVHTFLGASGYRDNNYSLTLALLAKNEALKPMANEEDPATDSEKYRSDKISWNKLNFARLMMVDGGGFTGVGGGGDGTSVQAKLDMLSNMDYARTMFPESNECSGTWSSLTDFAKSIMEARIESAENIDVPKFDYSDKTQAPLILIPRYLPKLKEIPEAAITKIMAMICVLQNGKSNRENQR
ncbi:MAG: hypothetical protein ACXVCP_18020 [Bdellovibrio sp.]